LRERYASLDPFALKDEVDKRLKQILHAQPKGAAPPQNQSP